MRDTLIILGVCIIAVALGAWLFFVSPNGIPFLSGNSLAAAPVTVLEQGVQTPGVTSQVNYRIQNTKDFATLWKMVYGDNAPTPPTVDFASDEVLAVFDGQHPTGGYTISITQIVDEKGTRKVYIQHQKPGASCAATQETTSPFEIISVPKTSNTITHIDQVNTTDCAT